MITRAVSTWSLNRTLGRFTAQGSAVNGSRTSDSPIDPEAVALIDLPPMLQARGYEAVQICHFHIPSRDEAYLADLRTAFEQAGVVIDAILIDDGDLTSDTDPEGDEAWISSWLDTAISLGAHHARVGAGHASPTRKRLKESATRLLRLALSHPQVRVITENWHELLNNADSVNTVLDLTGSDVGLLVDLGNWSGPDKYDQLAQIAERAEACHAKCRFTAEGPDADDYGRALQVMKAAGFSGPMVLIYDGPNDDEWGGLDTEWALVQKIFA